MLFWSLRWLVWVPEGLVSSSHRGDISPKSPALNFFYLFLDSKSTISYPPFFPAPVCNKKPREIFMRAFSLPGLCLSSTSSSLVVPSPPLCCLLSRPLVAWSWQSQCLHLTWPLSSFDFVNHLLFLKVPSWSSSGLPSVSWPLLYFLWGLLLCCQVITFWQFLELCPWYSSVLSP